MTPVAPILDPAFDEFESTRILTVPRVLIYPERHPFACGKGNASAF